LILLASMVLGPASAASQGSNVAAAFRAAHEAQVLSELAGFLAIPNVASDAANIAKNASALGAMLAFRGFPATQLVAKGAPPAITARWTVPGATRTLVLYAHYDGQPADPAKWKVTQPWRPLYFTRAVERGGRRAQFPVAGQRADSEARIYARGASDDKGGVMAILTALDALRVAGKTPTSNVILFFEGEEEAGSPHLPEVLHSDSAGLKADAWVFVDGPVHQSGAKEVLFGVRGDMHIDVTTYGANRPLHSGHYGNWAPNPAEQLARLLTTMKDSTGRVTIAGWYDDVTPLGQAERAANADLAAYDTMVARELGIGRPYAVAPSLAEAIELPSLNINGIASADVGAQARNVIPTTATVALDVRLVLGNDHDRMFQKLVEHVRRQGYLVLDRAPTDSERLAHPLIATVVQRAGSYDASRTPMDLPLAQSVVQALRATTPGPVMQLPTSGGSLPLIYLTDILHVPTLMVPIANYDNNQHAEDENLRIGNFWSGVESIVAILSMH
jgi:acetylornithine deacetylase/succinyl-diaminopimelate desuccinylase-like protein